MPNYLFDIRLNASIRLDAETPEQARAAIKAALDCAEVNAGSWPDGSPIIFEASLDADDCCDEDAMSLIEVDGEDPEAADLPPLPCWAGPIITPTNADAVFRTIRNASDAQNAAMAMRAFSRRVMTGFEDDDPPSFSDALIYGMGAQHVAVKPEFVGIDRGAQDQTVTVLMVRVDPETFLAVGPDELELLSAELRDAIDAAKARNASSPDTPKEDSTDA